MSDLGPVEPVPEPDRRPLLERLGDRPVPTALAGLVLTAALAVAAVTALRDDGPDLAAPAPVTPSPSASPSPLPPPPSPTASASPSPSPSPSASPADWPDPSCEDDLATEAVCRFVLALQSGELEGLTEGEQALARVETDLPDAPFAVSSCELEGDVTVLCEVGFRDPEQIAAGFRVAPANGEYDAETGQVVVAPGEQLRYEVVEAVGMRRDAPAPPPPPSPSSAAPSPAPAPAGLVLGGDELGVTRVGAPYRDAVRAVSRVLGPPSENPSASTACIGAEQLEVAWPGFRLAVSEDRVSGWSADDARLQTPSGVAVGSTVAELRRIYGERLRLYEAGPDAGPGFTVEGVELGGDLDPSGRVTRLWNRVCSSP